jgi:hypothetical protein
MALPLSAWKPSIRFTKNKKRGAPFARRSAASISPEETKETIMSEPILSQNKQNGTLFCTYCSAEAVSWRGVIIQPPVCAAHYDLLILVEYMEGRNEPVVLESVQHRLAWALSNGGDWAITAGQLPELLPPFLHAREAQKNSQHAAQDALANIGTPAIAEEVNQ